MKSDRLLELIALCLVAQAVLFLSGCGTTQEYKTYEIEKNGIKYQVQQYKQCFHHRWIPCLFPSKGKLVGELEGIDLPDLVMPKG